MLLTEGVLMPAPLVLKFISTLAFAIQFLIFVYLYQSHRIRFFHYLLWGWGFFTVSKGLKLAEAVLPAGVRLDPLMDAAGIAALFCVLVGAAAYRWDYRMRGRDALVAGSFALAVVVLGERSSTGPGLELGLGIILGLAQAAAGLAFWPRLSAGMAYRGAGLLAASFLMWGLYRIATGFVAVESGPTTYYAVYGAFICFHFLSTFATILMVLDRAPNELRSLKELNQRLVAGLRAGVPVVAGAFTVRYSNPRMVETFGPPEGRGYNRRVTVHGGPVAWLT